MSRQFTYYGSFASKVFFTDLFGIPAAAFSLRKLSPNAVYSGAAIRVRRSSDNTEQDINFVSSAVDAALDTTALTTFVGASNGFVTTWYDQSGNGKNFTQTTGSLQGRIVNSGSVELLGGLPCINILNGNEYRNAIFGNARQDTYIVRSNSKSVYLKQNGVSASNFDYVASSGDGTTTLFSNYGSPSLYANKVLFTGTTRGQVFTHLNGHKIEVQQNASTSIWTSFRLGGYGGSFNYEGLISEFIQFTIDKSTQRDSINDNQNAYYNVF